MKEFDFVKLTLWLAAVLTLALGVGYFVVGGWITKMDRDIAQIKTICTQVGLVAKDIKTLEDEKRNDKTPDSSDAAIHTFFLKQASRNHIEPNTDYTLKSRDRDTNTKAGYTDEQFQLDFKKDHLKTREQIFGFIYNCETQSRRIKLQKASISLDADQATADLWRADSLTFVRRDPIKSASN